MKKTHKKCKCWTCNISPKIRKFTRSLNVEQKREFDEFFSEVWDNLEAAETDLGVLNSKIEGTWPIEDQDESMLQGYYTRINGKLYWFRGVPMPN